MSRQNGEEVNVCLFVDRCRDALTAERIDRIDKLTDDIDTARVTHLIRVAHYSSAT